jgi:cytochrome c oxidase subunit I+III
LTVLILVAVVALSASLGIETLGHWQYGLRPDGSGYAAMVYLAAALQVELVVALLVAAFYVLARLAAGRLDGARPVTFESFALLLHYTVGQGLLGLLLVHGFPRLVG